MSSDKGRACPECGGTWLYCLTFDHVGDNGCGLRAADDATIAADHERLAGAPWGMLRRPATETEQAFGAALGMPAWSPPAGIGGPAPPMLTVVTAATVSVRRRRLQWGDGPLFDPDAVVPVNAP